MKHLSLNSVDVKAMLRSGYAVRTAQQFEFLSIPEQMDLVQEISVVIRSRLPLVATSSLWIDNPTRRQLMEDIIDQVRHMRWPSYAAIEAVYNEVSHSPLEGVEHEEVVAAFHAGYEMRYGNEFFAHCGAMNVPGAVVQGLWEAIVSVRNGDAILPSTHELLK